MGNWRCGRVSRRQLASLPPECVPGLIHHVGEKLPLKACRTMAKPDLALRGLVAAIVAGDATNVSRLLAASPALATACFQSGATRQTAKPNYLDQIERYVFAGDTALHMAAAAYQTAIVRTLITAGADVHARNRFGDEALHAAAVGRPGSRTWNPPAQAATIICLIKAGADAN